MPNNTIPLTLNSRGVDVLELHISLNKLGYAIPKHELNGHVFGLGT